MGELTRTLVAEYLKIRRSKVLWLTTASLCLAPLFGALFVIVLRNPELAAGNEALRGKADLSGFTADWPSFFGLISQAVGVGGVVVFGFVASWVFGREYSDRTIKEILCYPVGRTTIVWAKAIACACWCLMITVVVSVVALITGALLKLPGWDNGLLIASIGRVIATAGLVIALTPPVFFVASAGKGYLASLGFVVLTVVFAQIIGALGYGAFVPWAVPALFSGLGSEAGGNVAALSFALVAIAGMFGMGATILWWNYADQAK